ncbi:sodium:solute symporter [candidate division KSB1 bacterium]|nr:sodium:solute symporter [candidate division KSB1 bacterium]
MTPLTTTIVLIFYFGLLFVISVLTSRRTTAETFFTADRKMPWPLVAYGMIGVGISGITFISVPGEVGNSQFTYFQLVIGYAIGLAVIALVLLPLYYRLKLVSIYSYLENRFGVFTHKTGALFFQLAQTFTAAFKLYLMAGVLQLSLFDPLGVPFEVTVLVTLLLIWLYTVRSGIKTVVFTDTLQTTFLLAAVVLSIRLVGTQLDLSVPQLVTTIIHNPNSKIFVWNWSHPRFFVKLVLTGIFLTIVTNGVDHSVMQKHLTCPGLRQSQKNMFVLTGMLLAVNLLFLSLGLLLYQYASALGITLPERTDDLYPLLALKYFSPFAGIVFLLGMAAAAYSSADSALTGLTTSFCVDILNFEKRKNPPVKIRPFVHLGFSLLIFLVILVFRKLNNESVVNAFIRVSGYVYGPLLGLFVYGMLCKRTVRDRFVPIVCVLAPVISILLYFNSEKWFFYRFGFEILVVNALLTVLGLFFLGIRVKRNGSEV